MLFIEGNIICTQRPTFIMIWPHVTSFYFYLTFLFLTSLLLTLPSPFFQLLFYIIFVTLSLLYYIFSTFFSLPFSHQLNLTKIAFVSSHSLSSFYILLHHHHHPHLICTLLSSTVNRKQENVSQMNVVYILHLRLRIRSFEIVREVGWRW